MVAETEPVVEMSELNKIRTDRLANALKMKNLDLSRSQSVRNRYNNTSPKISPTHHGHTVGFKNESAATILSANSNSNSLEFRRRACTLPSKVRPPYSPSIYSQAPTMSPRSPSSRLMIDPILVDDELTVVERMRTFTLDPEKASVTNRGDSFRARANTTNLNSTPKGRRSVNGGGSSKNSSGLSSRSHSPVPVGLTDSIGTPIDLLSPNTTEDGIRKYHIIVLGSAGVGKTSMINQFMTSDYCNPFQTEKSEPRDENTVSVLLDGEESKLTFIEVNNEKSDMWLSLSGAGYIIAYSVANLASFRNAEQALYELRQRTHTSKKPIILVGNKIDLERKRLVSTEEGKHAAKENNCKFVEIAVALGHHVDELLVGVLAQARLSENNIDATPSIPGSKSELIATFDMIFPSALQPHDRSSSGSSSGSNNGGGGRTRRRTKTNVEKESQKQTVMEKWNSLKKLDDAMATGCSNISSVGGKFVQKLFGRRRRSHSLEDLLAFQRR